MSYPSGSAWLLGLTYMIVSLQGIGTIWDCSAIFYFAIDTGRPFVYPYRYTDFFFGWVVVAAHRFTDNIRLLEALFAYAHLSVTLLAWLLCVYLLRRSSDIARLLTALMILAIPLPGQAYVCTDVNHVAVLMPVLVVLAVEPMSRTRVALFSAISVFSFLDHPGSMFSFLLLAVVLAAKKRLDGRFDSSLERFACLLTALLLVGSVWRFAFGLSEYERAEMQVATTVSHFRLGLWGFTGIAVALTYLAAGGFLAGRLDPARRRATAWERVAGGALLVAAACILLWASDSSRWIHGDTYRKFVMLLNVPLGIVLAAILLLERHRVTAVSRTSRTGLASAALSILLFVHAGCLFLQSTNYAQSRARLAHELSQARTGLIFLGKDHWAFMTPLRIWALPFNSILLQGRRPKTIATFSSPSNTVVDSPHHMIRFGEIPDVSIASAGWFQFDRLREIGGKARLLKTEGPYPAERFDDGSTLHWTDRTLRYEFESAAPRDAPARIQFRYLSATRERRAQIRVFRGFELILEGKCDMSGAYLGDRQPGQCASGEFPAGPGRYSIEITSVEPAIVLGGGDPRKLAFMVLDSKMVYRAEPPAVSTEYGPRD